MRRKRRSRKTRETDVRVSIDLDGSGRADLALPDRWLKHMLESLAKFARFDLKLRATGDFQHHINEDVAITMGRAFREALRNRPTQRVGTATAPMDDALVTVAVDLVDRPYCHVDLPDEMLAHFLRSFAMEAGITVHSVVVRGRNFHHVAEASFKALGLALREAVRPDSALRTTKGAVRWG